MMVPYILPYITPCKSLDMVRMNTCTVIDNNGSNCQSILETIKNDKCVYVFVHVCIRILQTSSIERKGMVIIDD